MAGPQPWPAGVPPATDNGEVRTIFIVGFPPDVKERELMNLLRWLPGYEASQMNFKGDHPTGFARFSTAALAMAAMDALQNMQFDQATNSILRVEMAKKNLYLKRGVAGETGSVDQSKRLRTAGDYLSPHYAPSSAFSSVPPHSWGHPSYISAAPPYDPYGSYGMPSLSPIGQAALPPVTPAGYAPVQNMKDNPPCNTLFVGNLGEHTSEAELQRIFAVQPGFRRMKVLKQGKSTVCFIEYADVSSATAVHTNLQGAILSTSDRGGMRLQYSKNPFGIRKDSMHTEDGGAPGVSDANGRS